MIGQFLKKTTMKFMLARQGKSEHRMLDLESMHPNPFVPDHNESIYFACLGHDHVSLISRMAFRTGKHNENWLMVHVPGEGTWGFEDRVLLQGKGFKQGQLEFKCVEPGKNWRLTYDGTVTKDQAREHVSVDVQWIATTPIADFSKVGTFPGRLAELIGEQAWSLEFFRRLKNLSAVHYEQGGRVEGKITFKGRQIPIVGAGLRDHSYGVRNWSDFRRHLWCVGMLEDGRFFNFSMADYYFLSGLKASFMLSEGVYLTPHEAPGFDDLKLGSDPLPGHMEFFVIPKPGDAPVRFSVDMEEFFYFHMDKGDYLIREARSSCNYGGTKGVCIAEMGIDPKSHEIDFTHR